jgi:hypothetical protein
MPRRRGGLSVCHPLAGVSVATRYITNTPSLLAVQILPPYVHRQYVGVSTLQRGVFVTAAHPLACASCHACPYDLFLNFQQPQCSLKRIRAGTTLTQLRRSGTATLKHDPGAEKQTARGGGDGVDRELCVAQARATNDAGGSTSDVHVRVRGVRCVALCMAMQDVQVPVHCGAMQTHLGHSRL